MAIRIDLAKTVKPLFCESKWWGDPDMPADMEYPMMKVEGEEDYPLTFVCQIRCEDIAALDPEGLLPHDGMLYFFAAVDEYAGYDSPVHLGIGEWPKGSVIVKYTKSINMETFQSFIMVDDDDQPVTDEALEMSFSSCDDQADGIKLLGIPFFEEVRDQYPDCVNLLQIDGDETADINFYDSGMLNIMVSRTDLDKGLLKKAENLYAFIMNIAKFHFNPLEECCYLVWDETGEAAIVDPGFYDGREAEALYGKIQERGLTPKMILLTHGHFDHIYGVAECSRHYGIPVMMSADDKVILENNSFFTGGFGLRAADGNFDFKPVAEGDSVKFGNIELQVIATPGHTPGGVCWYGEKDAVLFSGDTLFAGAIGRTDNAWGDYDKMIVAIMDKLMGLDGHVSVLPGHGPESSIAYERTHNPFLQPFNEPGGDDLDWDAEGIELDGTRE